MITETQNRANSWYAPEPCDGAKIDALIDTEHLVRAVLARSHLARREKNRF